MPNNQAHIAQRPVAASHGGLSPEALGGVVVLIVAVAGAVVARLMRKKPDAKATLPRRNEVRSAPPEQLEESNNIRRYEVLEEVGRGAMAVVHRAKSLKTGNIVAIKLIGEGFKGDDEFIARFQRESEISRQLRHPNIVRLLAVEKDPAKMFMAMEFVDGCHLDQLVPPGGMAVDEALRLAIPIAEGLQYAHKRGLWHRDIKASNIMVNKEGNPKILDFGLALGEGMSRFTMVGFSMGTPTYMAPEQLTTGEIDARSDQYSYGVVVYQMLAGHCPFEGKDSIQVGMRHVKEAPERLRIARPEIPEALERIVLKLLAKKPADRFADMGLVADALRACQ